ncbi:hypothetical protein JHK87_047424 [Glycine soja]|nr:hypothetical protein JHK87_047424 [Glycine soja]
MATMMASTYKAYLGVGLGPLEVGQIFQKFECGDESHGGLICNVVQCSIPNFLEILQFLRTFKGQILVKDPRRYIMGYVVEIVTSREEFVKAFTCELRKLKMGFTGELVTSVFSKNLSHGSFLCGDELNSVLAENDSASVKSSKVTVSQSVQEGLLNDKGDTESEETVENVA